MFAFQRHQKSLKTLEKCVFFENVAFLILIRFGPPFWSILDASGGVLGRPGGFWGAKMEPKEFQKAPKMRSKMRYGNGRAILTKMLLSLEPQKDF